MAAPFSDLGFALGIVRGARTFLLTTDGWLTGLYYRQVWLPGEINHATCRKEGGYVHLPDNRDDVILLPDNQEHYETIDKAHMLLPEERCGFYGYYDGSNDYNPPANPKRDMVSGVVEGFGSVLIGERGFRAQKARIVALQIPKNYPKRYERIIMRYASVPMFTSFRDMMKAFPCEDGSPDEEVGE